MTGMEVRPDRHGPVDSDVAIKKGVGATDPGGQRTLDERIEMHHLPLRVHTGVSPAGCHDGHRPPPPPGLAPAAGDPEYPAPMVATASHENGYPGNSHPARRARHTLQLNAWR